MTFIVLCDIVLKANIGRIIGAVSARFKQQETDVKHMLIEGNWKGGNCARYMPCLQHPEGKVWFHALPYHSNVGDDEARPVAGIGLGLVTVNDGAKAKGISLEQGGHIVRTAPLPNGKMPQPRDYEVNKKDKRRYIDFGVFKEIGDEMFLRAWAGERVVNVEVVTGVPNRDAAHQLRAFDIRSWHALCHGSVAISGTPRIIVDTGANETADSKLQESAGMGALPKIMATRAKLKSHEHHGDVVGDCALQISRTWEIEYTRKSSQAILVRQFDLFVLIVVADNGVAVEDIQVRSADYKDKFELECFEQGFLPALPATAAA